MQLSQFDQFLATLDDNDLDSFIDLNANDYSKHSDYVVTDSDIDWIIANDTNY